MSKFIQDGEQVVEVASDDNEYRVREAVETSADRATGELLSALNDASDSATVSIHRQNGSGKQSLSFLDSFAPDKYTSEELLQYIKNTYGSGDYRIHVRDAGRLVANKHVSIEAPKALPVPRETNNSGLPELIAMMNQQNNAILEALQKSQQPVLGPSRQEMLQEMMIMKEMFSGAPVASEKPRGFADIIETVNGLKSLGINVGGIDTSEKEDGFGDILEKVTPMIGALIASNSMNNQQRQQQQPQRPPQQQQQKPTPTNPTEEQEIEEMNLKLKMGLMALVNAAKKNADTAFYADLVLDQFPDDKVELLLSSDAVEQLIAIYPKVAEYRVWFLDVLEHVKGMLGKGGKYADQYDDTVLTGEAETVTTEAPKNSL